jgi:hypothetical protein
MLCRHFRTGRATCLRILHNKLVLQKFHLCWVQDTLSINQKGERVLCSNVLLMALREQKGCRSQRMITGGELSECIKHKIDTEKTWF